MSQMMYPFAANGMHITDNPFAGTDQEMFDQLADEMLTPSTGMWMDDQGILHPSTLDGEVNGQRLTDDPFAGTDQEMFDQLADEMLSPSTGMWMDDRGILHPSTLDGEVNGQRLTDDPFAGVPAPPQGHADQWYSKNPALYRAEVEAMMKAHKQAKLRFMPESGDMCWVLELKIADFCKPWQFLLRYMKDHPNNRNYGGSIRVIPLKHPSIAEIRKRAKDAGRPGVPHLLSERNANDPYTYLCTRVQSGVQNGVDAVSSGVQVATWAADWALHFEISLYDDRLWNKWCDDAHFRDWKVANPKPRRRPKPLR